MIIFPSGVGPAAAGGGRGGRGGGGGGGGAADAAAARGRTSRRSIRVSSGRTRRPRPAPHLKKFLEDGGTILAVGRSAMNLAELMGLPVDNHLVERSSGRHHAAAAVGEVLRAGLGAPGRGRQHRADRARHDQPAGRVLRQQPGVPARAGGGAEGRAARRVVRQRRIRCAAAGRTARATCRVASPSSTPRSGRASSSSSAPRSRSARSRTARSSSCSTGSIWRRGRPARARRPTAPLTEAAGTGRVRLRRNTKPGPRAARSPALADRPPWSAALAGRLFFFAALTRRLTPWPWLSSTAFFSLLAPSCLGADFLAFALADFTALRALAAASPLSCRLLRYFPGRGLHRLLGALDRARGRGLRRPSGGRCLLGGPSDGGDGCRACRLRGRHRRLRHARGRAGGVLRGFADASSRHCRARPDGFRRARQRAVSRCLACSFIGHGCSLRTLYFRATGTTLCV